MNLEIPVVETERLRLRELRASDYEAMTAMWADPRVVEFIGGKPFTAAQTWGKILSCTGLWPVLGYGYWGVEEKISGKFVGNIGFADFKRELTPSIEGIPELGWVNASEFAGRGYATEGVRAAARWMDEKISPPRTVCIIDPGNIASIRVAEKCGFRDTVPATYSDSPKLLLNRFRS